MQPRYATRALLADGAEAARHAKLGYVGCDEPGIRRVRYGNGFRYLLPSGAPVSSARVLARIRSLAIPPAWTDVWICQDEDGHLQATGRDARGRKQYRYHPRWREVRDEAKHDDMLAFARALPQLRRRIARDLMEPRLTKDKVIATILRIMERTAIRIGNDQYAEQNRTFGLTTLLDRHATISRDTISFSFRGKANKPYRASLRDARLASIVKRCRDIPGQRLFQYLDDAGTFRAVTSSDVNEYLKRATGEEFTSKTFRTWEATLLATVLLSREAAAETSSAARRTVRRVIVRVSEQLCNTPAVCKKSYIHPNVLTAYVEGSLTRGKSGNSGRKRAAQAGLYASECTVLALLERSARELRRPPRAA